jgi:putative photosynthetic complex assembly protein
MATSPEYFPRLPLLSAAGLVGLALLAVATARLVGVAPERQEGQPSLSRDLRFADRSDGGVAVLDASGQLVEVLPPGSNNFLRATLRGLARERRAEGTPGNEAPFRLSAWPQGGLTLEDLATGRQVQLAAFGPANVQAFGRLLTAHGETP